MEILALQIGTLWSHWIWPIFQFVIGLGLVIYVHELGHFLAAKWAGIKVEELALGFGKRLWGFRRGETEYRVNLLPVGGYVKMLGQDDFKPALQEQTDPRSWQGAPIGKRLVVLSAGVAMNVVMAAVLFVLVCLAGIRFPAAVVGGVAPGYPAAEAEIVWQDGPTTAPATAPASAPAVTRGLQPGDRILQINGKEIVGFNKLTVKAVLADPDEVFTMKIERDWQGLKRIGTAEVGVKSVRADGGGKRLAFGIEPAADLVLDDTKDLLYEDAFRAGDTIVAINGQEIRHAWEIPAIEEALDGSAVTVTVRRGGKNVDVQVTPGLNGGKLGDLIHHDGSRLYGKIVREGEDEVLIRLEDGTEKELPRDEAILAKDEMLDILGMTPRIRVRAVDRSSPAAKAELRPGDIIAAYGDRGVPTYRKLLDINEQVADSGTDIVVVREGKRLPPVRIMPARHKGRVLVGMLPTNDLAHMVVAGVRAGSPAAGAGIRSEDVIEKVNAREVKTWTDLFQALKALPGQDVSVTYRRGTAVQTVELGKLGKELFDPGEYAFTLFTSPRPFRPLMGPVIQKKNPLSAIAWGVGETADFTVMTYAMIRGWVMRRLSGRLFSGPVGIGGAAIQVGRRSFTNFVYLMAMICVSLAVINFLPLPVLDGGHVVLALIEKVRGRPLPLKVLAGIQIAGLVLIVGLFVALTWNDISKLLWHSW